MRVIHAITTACLFIAAGSASAQEAMPEAQRAANTLAATTCSACHGTAGRSTSSTFPNLAAQTAPYIEEQLKAFRDQTRADPDAEAYMWGMASQLSDATIGALAAHYAAQAPPAGRAGNTQRVARGKAIFEQGLLAKGIPACATCHGAHAQGNGPFPRLAGQHADYLLKQMLVIQSVLRLAPVMHGVIQNLTREQMRDLAVYLASIGPAAK
jgi:cytochrome c553